MKIEFVFESKKAEVKEMLMCAKHSINEINVDECIDLIQRAYDDKIITFHKSVQKVIDEIVNTGISVTDLLDLYLDAINKKPRIIFAVSRICMTDQELERALQIEEEYALSSHIKVLFYSTFRIQLMLKLLASENSKLTKSQRDIVRTHAILAA